MNKLSPGAVGGVPSPSPSPSRWSPSTLPLERGWVESLHPPPLLSFGIKFSTVKSYFCRASSTANAFLVCGLISSWRMEDKLKREKKKRKHLFFLSKEHPQKNEKKIALIRD